MEILMIFLGAVLGLIIGSVLIMARQDDEGRRIFNLRRALVRIDMLDSQGAEYKLSVRKIAQGAIFADNEEER